MGGKTNIYPMKFNSKGITGSNNKSQLEKKGAIKKDC
jgi:hypothetical protein